VAKGLFCASVGFERTLNVKAAGILTVCTRQAQRLKQLIIGQLSGGLCSVVIVEHKVSRQ
jgi:hypothetical protein